MRNKKDFIYIFIVWSLAIIGFYKAVKYAIIHVPYLFSSVLLILFLWAWYEDWGRRRLGGSQSAKEEEERWRRKWDKLEPTKKVAAEPVPICMRQVEIWREELNRDWQAVQNKSAARATVRGGS